MATRQRKNRGKDLDDINVGGGDTRPRIEELIQVYKFPEGKWVRVRLHGPVYTTGGFWVTVKKKDGSRGAFYTPAVSYDPDTQTLDSTIADPFRDAQKVLNTEENQVIQFAKRGYINGIVRSEQKNLPSRIRPTKEEEKTGFKDRDSDTPTPNKAIPLTPGLLKKIQALKELNTVEGKRATKAYAVTHPEFGCDIMIKYDSKASAANMYEVQISTQKPMTEEEKTYLLQNLERIEEAEAISEEEARKDLEGWAERNGHAEALGLTGGKTKKAKPKVEDDFDDDFDDGEEEVKEPKSKKSKKASGKVSKKGSKKVKVEVEDDPEDDFDDSQEDDEPTPEEEVKEPKSKKAKKASGKSSKKGSKKAKSKVGDEEVGSDEAPKKKSKTKTKSKPKAQPEKVEDNEDDDLDDFDDDFDDED